MTRQQRRSKSRLHNRMKRRGYKWYRSSWWEAWRFDKRMVALGNSVPIYHADWEEAKGEK